MVKVSDLTFDFDNNVCYYTSEPPSNKAYSVRIVDIFGKLCWWDTSHGTWTHVWFGADGTSIIQEVNEAYQTWALEKIVLGKV